MARRFTAHTGLPLSLEALQYNIFSSTFSGTGIVAGPAKRPLLKVARLELRLALMGGKGGRGVTLLKAEGVRGKISGRRLLGRHAVRPGRALAVGRAVVKIDRWVFTGAGGITLVLKGAVLKVQGLKVPASGDLRRLGGKVQLTAKLLKVGKLAFTDLSLEGELKSGALRILSLEGVGPGGRGELDGRLTLKKDRLGGLDLKGAVTAMAEGGLQGKIRLKGKSLQRLTLSGECKGGGAVLRASGTSKAAPGIKLNLKLGHRRLTGTLKKWRIR